MGRRWEGAKDVASAPALIIVAGGCAENATTEERRITQVFSGQENAVRAWGRGRFAFEGQFCTQSFIPHPTVYRRWQTDSGAHSRESFFYEGTPPVSSESCRSKRYPCDQG